MNNGTVKTATWYMNNDTINLYSIAGWCLAQVSYIISINVVDLYDYIFKALSMISLTVILSINLKKHWKDFASIRKRFINFILFKKSKKK